MLPLSTVSAREAVHLLILRELTQLRGDPLWVVKGGVNLRLFFKSPRYSEDMDLAAERDGAGAIRRCLESIFTSRTLLRLLHDLGIRGLDPGQGPNKDTDTTFRYKFQIIVAGDIHLPTKVEVSFRGGHDEDPFERAAPKPDITDRYDMRPVVLRHYTWLGAVRQKIDALAGRVYAQARDVFDLHVLMEGTTEGVAEQLANVCGDAELSVGYDRALEMTFEEYRGQVIEFLEPATVARYGTEEAWDEIRLLVAGFLERVIALKERR